MPTFEQDLIRISDVRLNGFDQPINDFPLDQKNWNVRIRFIKYSSTRIGIGIWGGSTSVREIYNTIQNTIEFVQFLQPKKSS